MIRQRNLTATLYLRCVDDIFGSFVYIVAFKQEEFVFLRVVEQKQAKHTFERWKANLLQCFLHGGCALKGEDVGIFMGLNVTRCYVGLQMVHFLCV